jgi:hypothetical protein
VVVEQSRSYVELENMIQKWQWQRHVQRRGVCWILRVPVESHPDRRAEGVSIVEVKAAGMVGVVCEVRPTVILALKEAIGIEPDQTTVKVSPRWI